MSRFTKKQTQQKDLYDFIAELFRNYYRDSVIAGYVRDCTGERMKKNFIDNADKLRKKYPALEKKIKSLL